MNKEEEIDSYAIHCFRDMADRDYVAARICYRAQLMPQFLWLGLQAVEKYTKCILLLNRIPSHNFGHDIRKSLFRVLEIDGLVPCISEQSLAFTRLLYEFGRSRYLENGYNSSSYQIVYLDCLVAEVRRCCAKPPEPYRDGCRYIRLQGGVLESILDDSKDPAHEGLTWQNGFFGNDRLDKVSLPVFVIAERPRLVYSPELVHDITKYVHLPKAIREHHSSLAEKGDQRGDNECD